MNLIPRPGLAFACIAFATASHLLAAYSIPELGATRESIIKSLGEPIGSIELRDKELLLYPQGEITLKSGKATQIDLMAADAFAADQKRLEQERAEWEIAQAKMIKERTKQGEAVKADKLADLRFNGLPPQDQVTFWRNFQNTYPEVDVSDQLADAMEAYKTEVAELRKKELVAELEARVLEAEKATTEAQRENQRLKDQLNRNQYYGLRYYTDPVIKREYYYRPPTIIIHTDGTIDKETKPTPRNKARLPTVIE